MWIILCDDGNSVQGTGKTAPSPSSLLFGITRLRLLRERIENRLYKDKEKERMNKEGQQDV